MLFYFTSVTPWYDSDDSFTVMPRILKSVAVGLLYQLYERFLVRFYWSTTTKETVAVISRSSKMAFKLPTLSLKSISCKSNDDLESFDFGELKEKEMIGYQPIRSVSNHFFLF